MYCLMCLLTPNYRGIWKTSVSLTSVTCQRLPWNCSRSNSTWNLVLCFSWYGDSWSKAEPWRSLPTLMILWICDWHKVRAFGELSLLLINRPEFQIIPMPHSGVGWEAKSYWGFPHPKNLSNKASSFDVTEQAFLNCSSFGAVPFNDKLGVCWSKHVNLGL